LGLRWGIVIPHEFFPLSIFNKKMHEDGKGKAL
jgi:hypothetical protein